jgi:Zn-dependent protease with chaperone function
MIIAVTLFVYAAMMATVGAWLLNESTWPTRAPMLGIAAWFALAVSVLSSVILGAAALSVRLHLISTDLAEIFRVCVTHLRAAYATPGGAATTTIAVALLAAVSARTTWGVASTLTQAAGQRRRQLQILDLVASHNREFDMLVLDHPAPAAFCLPGRGRSIVVTSTALALLSRDELAAVLAHERAHLRGRHHLLVAFAQCLARAYPSVPVFVWGYEQVRRLVELAADDRASRDHGRSSIANAIVVLAGTAPPTAALALGTEATEVRLQRLTEQQTPLRPGAHRRLRALVVAMVLAPALVAILPALIAASMDYCGVGG